MTSPRFPPISTSTPQRSRRPKPDPTPPMKVLGIDPGTAMVGFGVVERLTTAGCPIRLVECGVFRTRAADSLSRRLAVIHEGLTELLERHRPDVLAVED